MLRLLAKFKILRNTPLDVFGYTAERKMERALIKQYEGDMKQWLPKASADTLEPLIALAELPLQIRGFGPVKLESEVKAAKRREELLIALQQAGSPMKNAAE
jgi:indolepyruvate ferredoxin oxidoreductase